MLSAPTLPPPDRGPRVENPAADPVADPLASQPVGVPEAIGRYKVLRLIGAGGMGVVMAAYDERLDRRVAIKLLHGRHDGPEARHRLLREAQALARLSHPNVVAVYETGVADGQVYLAMEFIAGLTLRAWLAERIRSVEEIRAIFLQAGRGLAAAHEVGLIHRDFKPDNVLISAGVAHVCDFGIARMDHEIVATHGVGPVVGDSITMTGAVLGTPAYMAPEQMRGLGVDRRADVYGFCMTLFEALHGHRPEAGGSPRARVQVTGPRVVPEWLRAIALRGIEAEADARWQDMPSLLAALAHDPVAARRRALKIAGAVTLVAVLAAALPGLWDRLQQRWEHQRRETLAAQRLEVMIERATAGEAAGKRVEAKSTFDEFIRASEHQGTAALGQAWYRRGASLAAVGRAEEAQLAFASAHIEAQDEPLAIDAMKAIAREFHRRWQWRELGVILAGLRESGATMDPELARMAVDEALARRDFAGALARIDELGAHAPTELAELRPMIVRLARARRTALRGRFVQIDETGRVLAWDSEGDKVQIASRDLERQQDLPLTVPITASIAGTSFYLGRDSGDTVLVDMRHDPREAWRGRTDTRTWYAMRADLDGDGRHALYMSFEWPARHFLQLRDVDAAAPGQALEEVHRNTRLLDSGIETMVAGDLDGDGVRELVVATSAWHAFDLRVFQHGQPQLTLRHRLRLGRVGALGLLRDPRGGSRIIAPKDDLYPSPGQFPEAPHMGPTSGVYVLRWNGETLRREALLAAPRHDGKSLWLAGGGQPQVLATDFDRDGIEDAVIGIELRPVPATEQGAMLVLRQRSDGTFSSLLAGGLWPLALHDIDDDGAPELLVADAQAEDHVIWALGIGEDGLRPLRPPATPPGPAPAEIIDPSLNLRWGRATRLAAAGLAAAAARALREAAALASTVRQSRLALTQAAEFHDEAGEHAIAAEIYEEVAKDAALVLAVLPRWADSLLRTRALARALNVLETLARQPGLGEPRTAEVQRQIAALRSVTDPARTIRLTFDRPLAPEWQIHEPVLVDSDPVNKVLNVAANGCLPATLAFPFQSDGGPLSVRIDGTMTRAEYGSYLQFSIHDDVGRLVAATRFNTSGGIDFPTTKYDCVVEQNSDSAPDARTPRFWVTPADRPTESSRAGHEFSTELSLLSPLLPPDCEFSVDGQRYRAPLQQRTLAPGRYWLRLGAGWLAPDFFARGWNECSTLSAAKLRSIEIRGATPVGAMAEDALARGRRLLAERDAAGALEAFARADESHPSMPIWVALAHLQASRPDQAIATLRGSTSPTIDLAMIWLLHRDHERFGPIVRAAAGASFPGLLLASWGPMVGPNNADLPLLAAVVESLAALDAIGTGEMADEARRMTHRDLFILRSRAWAGLGHEDKALADIYRAIALEASIQASEGYFGPRDLITYSAAMNLTIARHPERSLAFLKRLVAEQPDPAVIGEKIERDPRYAHIIGLPEWEEVLGPLRGGATYAD